MQRRDFIRTGALWTLAAAVLPYKRRFWPVGIDLRKPRIPREVFLYGGGESPLATLVLEDGDVDLIISPYQTLGYKGHVDSTGVVTRIGYNGGEIPVRRTTVIAGQSGTVTFDPVVFGILS